jgi:hypothetical protein
MKHLLLSLLTITALAGPPITYNPATGAVDDALGGQEFDLPDGTTHNGNALLDSSSGVQATLFDAQSILAATADDTPAAVTVAEDEIVGRATGGNVGALTATQVRTIINVEDGATADQSDAEILTAVESESGRDMSADGTKLDGIETSATADQSDAEIEAAYNAQVGIVSQVDAEAGTSTTAERWTPERVKQAIDALGAAGDAWGDVVDADIVPDADGTRDLGTTGTRFAEAYTDALDVTNNIVVGGTVDGRDVATDGTKLDGVETAADVTDSTNVDAAGAVMEADYNANTILAATTDDTPVALTVAASTFVGRKASGDITDMSMSDARKLLEVEQGTYGPGTIMSPGAAYDVDADILIEIATAQAITITKIEVTCDADPATELDWDLYWADDFISKTGATLIRAMDTAVGVLSTTSGFNDATVASGKAIYATFAADPGDVITQIGLKITYTLDD